MSTVFIFRDFIVRAQNIWSFSATGNLQHGTDGDGHYKNTDHHSWRSSEDGGLYSPGQSERMRGGVPVYSFPQCPYLPRLQKGKENLTSLLFQIAIFNGVFPTYVRNNCLLCVFDTNLRYLFVFKFSTQ